MVAQTSLAAGTVTRPEGLGRDADFRKLWGALSVSLIGTQMTALALPLIALALGASPVQMGLLVAAGSVPVLPR